MPFQKDYETPATGAVATYHAVQQVSLDYVSNCTTALVVSYLSQATKDSGKQPLYSQQVQLTGLPPAGTDALAFAESQLIATPPADTVSVGNRYAFAGALLVGAVATTNTTSSS